MAFARFLREDAKSFGGRWHLIPPEMDAIRALPGHQCYGPPPLRALPSPQVPRRREPGYGKESDVAKQYVKDIRDKDAVKSVFQVARKTSTVAKNGKPFLAVTLRDRTGDLDARVWDKLEELDPKLNRGELALIEGLTGTFQGRPQLRIDAVENAPSEGVDPADFAPPPKSGPDDRHLAQIGDLIDRVADPHLRALLRSLLDDEAISADLRRAPAAKSIHHAYHGGLCEHTLSVMKLAVRVGEHYPMVDRDLLLAGAFLHDLGKIRELSFDKQTEYTDEGRLLGHLVITAQLIHEYARKVEGFPRALEAHLTHLVLSHHGSLEFGSPRLPQTLEAMLLHYVDEMDSRMGAWLDIMKRDPGESWTDFQKLYDRHLFKGAPPTAHGRPPVERRHKGDRKKARAEREKPHKAEGEEAQPSPAPGSEAPAQKAPEARPSRPEPSSEAAPRDRRERPPKKAEEKLTFKPFAALSPAAPPAGTAPAGAEASPAGPPTEVAAPMVPPPPESPAPDSTPESP